MLDKFPLKNPCIPSSYIIFEKQFRVPEYFIATPSAFLPDYIINLLLTVSNGNDTVSEVDTTNWAKKNFKNILAFLYPSSLPKIHSFPESYPPKYKALYTKIPITETPNPLYSPGRLSYLKILYAQSQSPLNYLSLAAFPISTPRRVLVKSKGYTIVKPMAPAKPPESRFPIKYLAFCFLGSIPLTNIC